jgi:hypothetical protein
VARAQRSKVVLEDESAAVLSAAGEVVGGRARGRGAARRGPRQRAELALLLRRLLQHLSYVAMSESVYSTIIVLTETITKIKVTHATVII